MGPRLESLDGGMDITLEQALVLVGRNPGCDLQINSPRISRRHCFLARLGDGIEVRDLESRNGTRINGRRVVQGRLRPGDELTIAQYRYRMVLGSASTLEQVWSVGGPAAEPSEAADEAHEASSDPPTGTADLAEVRDERPGPGAAVPSSSGMG